MTILIKQQVRQKVSLMKTTWKDTSIMHKIVTVITFPICIAVVVLAILQIIGVWTDAGIVYIPLLGLESLCQAYTNWKPKRAVAYVNLVSGILILAIAVAVFLLK